MKKPYPNVARLFMFLLAGFSLFFTPGRAACEVFENKYSPSGRYRILSVVDEAVFINNVLSHRTEILNRSIAVEVTDVIGGKDSHFRKLFTPT
jgi:hypothetical protein